MFMPRDFFGDVTDPSVRAGSRKWYTVLLSLAVHALALLALIVVPLVATGTLPAPYASVNFVPVATAPLPPPPAVHPAIAPSRVDSDAPPIEPPSGIQPESDFDRTFEQGNPEAYLGLGSIIIGDAAIPEPPPPANPVPREPVPIGGRIKQPQKVHDVAPIYPPIAQAARAQGVVVIKAVIGIDGRVQDASVLRSVPLLDEAALTAVRQWVYTPTMLNGIAVPVIMTVTVRFQLN